MANVRASLKVKSAGLREVGESSDDESDPNDSDGDELKRCVGLMIILGAIFSRTHCVGCLLPAR